MKLAVIVGHNPVTPGAVTGCGVSEFQANSELALQMKRSGELRGYTVGLFWHEARDARRQPTKTRDRVSYFGTVLPTLEAVNDWAPDCAVELHFNSVPERNAEGLRMRSWSGCFAYHHPGGFEAELLGGALASACAGQLGVPSLGSLPRKVSWAGAELLPLTRLRCPAIILETHNGRNPEDHAAFQHGIVTGALAGSLVRAAAAWRDP